MPSFEYVKAILDDTNFILLHGWNGKEGINYCMKEKRIDLIILDLKLPDMNGFEVFKRIRELLPEIPVIAQTAFARNHEKKSMIDYGFTDFISKPFKKSQLLSIINKQIRISKKNKK